LRRDQLVGQAATRGRSLTGTSGRRGVACRRRVSRPAKSPRDRRATRAPPSESDWRSGPGRDSVQAHRRSDAEERKAVAGRIEGLYPAALECQAIGRANQVAAADLTLMRSLQTGKVATVGTSRTKTGAICGMVPQSQRTYSKIADRVNKSVNFAMGPFERMARRNPAETAGLYGRCASGRAAGAKKDAARSPQAPSSFPPRPQTTPLPKGAATLEA
jgi:hypothetical protein